MKLLDKIRNAFFEEEEDEQPEDNQIVKKIDVSKTIKEEVKHEPQIKVEDEPLAEFSYTREEKNKGPIIFDDEDFVSDTKEVAFVPPKKEEKIVYGGYETKEKVKEKEKFQPSPVISPVYGVLDKNYKAPQETPKEAKKSLDQLFVEERKKKIDLDTIRQKAYGDLTEEIIREEPVEENKVLYEMQGLEDKPGIEKVTIGDAEEYFDDLGLEYDVDYTDLAKEKLTRSKKNKELTEVVEEEIKEDEKIKEELQETDTEEIEEKNLYDLIDMMYESKE